ncbi:TSUP family transporter [Rhodocyclus tenuis]|uniref:Probable membrane transporter protein n=1 Tax=Rhodocyclus gracilis TaxID=2929842 RepID=A0ABX0WIF4_9RHOO|nr:TSUP family transporter [Rhodocyclus gracilis]NJA88339.1 TSUP family transporter [Rhodocyclus gracilis]
MDLDPLVLAALGATAFCAGFIDSVVGGGGLLQIPALFSALPRELPATLFGTNKIASIVGTANAAWRYTRHVKMPWRTTLPAASAALVCSYLGAMAVTYLPRELLRPLILLLLIGAAIYTFRRKEFGATHQPRHSGQREILLALLLGGSIGFYDGFFGPGTGSFLIFLFVRVFGFDFLHASAAAKVVNVATNLAATAYFVPHGYYLLLVGSLMAVANVGGSFVGTRLALKNGSAFVRTIFLFVVSALIVKFAWDTVRHGLAA